MAAIVGPARRHPGESLLVMVILLRERHTSAVHGIWHVSDEKADSTFGLRAAEPPAEDAAAAEGCCCADVSILLVVASSQEEREHQRAAPAP